MGPNLYLTPPASFTHFHQDGHVRCCLCLRLYLSIISLLVFADFACLFDFVTGNCRFWSSLSLRLQRGGDASAADGEAQVSCYPAIDWLVNVSRDALWVASSWWLGKFVQDVCMLHSQLLLLTKLVGCIAEISTGMAKQWSDWAV